MAGSKKHVHGFAVTESQIALLSQCYALKGVLLKYDSGWVDFNVCCIASGGAIYPAVIGRLLGRSRVYAYAICKGVASRGLIAPFGKRKYAITPLGIEVVAYYWERYNFHRDVIIELERDRLRRLGIED